MESTEGFDLESLSADCVGRTSGSLFALRDQDKAEFTRRLRDSTVMITGAAGFIAGETLKHVLAAEPKIVYLVDASENGLAALSRALATSLPKRHPTAIRMILADITSPHFDRVIAEISRLDIVLHFAAVKHVRSERDSTSALRILDVNVVGTHRLVNLLEGFADPPQLFAVSTDKAASPTSMMGASKFIMENLLWGYKGGSTTTRFANVLFSSGSITESWLSRLKRREPLSTPLDTYRYLVTPLESGLICSHAVLAPDRTITVPSPGVLQPVNLEDLATNFLRESGRVASLIDFADWKRDPTLADPTCAPPGEYPLVCTPRDTTGEKQQEIFLAPDESAIPWTTDLSLIKVRGAVSVEPLLTAISEWALNPRVRVSLSQIREAIQQVIPEFVGSDSVLSLDSRI